MISLTVPSSESTNSITFKFSKLAFGTTVLDFVDNEPFARKYKLYMKVFLTFGVQKWKSGRSICF